MTWSKEWACNPFNPISTTTVLARGAYAHTTNKINFISANKSRVTDRPWINYLPSANGIKNTLSWLPTQGMGFSHRRSHPSKTCIAKDTLSNRNTGMKLTDNKFNHNEIDCKPSSITDPEQLTAKSATTGSRKRNLQSKQRSNWDKT